MLDQKTFIEQLQKLKSYADEQGRELEQNEVMSFFEGMELSAEQTEMIFDYIKARRSEKPELTEAEKEYLEEYCKTIPPEGTGPYLESFLGTVVRVAAEYVGQGITLEDLIQEGNMGLMTTMELLPERITPEEEKKAIEAGIRKTLTAVLEEQEQVKVTDEKMVNKINELVDKIKALTDELGYKPSVDEVSHFLNMKAEEIRNLLYLAGEEVEEEEPAEEDTEQGHGENCSHEHEHVHGEGCDCEHHHE